jgi:hypothetical protein
LRAAAVVDLHLLQVLLLRRWRLLRLHWLQCHKVEGTVALSGVRQEVGDADQRHVLVKPGGGSASELRHGVLLHLARRQAAALVDLAVLRRGCSVLCAFWGEECHHELKLHGGNGEQRQ